MKRRYAILCLAVLVASATAACGQHQLTTQTSVTEPVHTINVSINTGHVTVHSGGHAIAVTRTVEYQDQTPHTSQVLNNSTLTLTDGCSGCGTDYDLTVPASTALDITDHTGQITLDGIAAAVSVVTGTGDVKATSLRSQTVAVSVTTGSIDLAFAAAPTDVTAQSTTGNVTATLPPAAYDIQATTVTGRSKVTLPSTTSAPHHIRLSTRTGAVSARPA